MPDVKQVKTIIRSPFMSHQTNTYNFNSNRAETGLCLLLCSIPCSCNKVTTNTRELRRPVAALFERLLQRTVFHFVSVYFKWAVRKWRGFWIFALVDVTIKCIHRQWFLALLLSQCSDIYDRLLPDCNGVLPGGPQYWFCCSLRKFLQILGIVPWYYVL